MKYAGVIQNLAIKKGPIYAANVQHIYLQYRAVGFGQYRAFLAAVHFMTPGGATGKPDAASMNASIEVLEDAGVYSLRKRMHMIIFGGEK
jgi:ribonucleotide monophosphatase NagD (HAD superfamily)